MSKHREVPARYHCYFLRENHFKIEWENGPLLPGPGWVNDNNLDLFVKFTRMEIQHSSTGIF